MKIYCIVLFLLLFMSANCICQNNYATSDTMRASGSSRIKNDFSLTHQRSLGENKPDSIDRTLSPFLSSDSARNKVLPSVSTRNENKEDSLKYHQLLKEKLVLEDSINRLQAEFLNKTFMTNQLKTRVDSLTQEKMFLQSKQLELQKKENELSEMNDQLNKMNKDLGDQLQSKNALLEKQVKALEEKEALFAEKEQIYKDAINNSTVDKVKLEGSLQANNVKIEARDSELSYLRKDINDKETDIQKKNKDLEKFEDERETTAKLTESLRNNLDSANIKLLKIQEEKKYVEQRMKDAEARLKESEAKDLAQQARKKRIRFIQGVAIRSYRTPNWSFGPSASDPSKAVLINKNAGNLEFDYYTGASIKLKDLTTEDSKTSYDAGFFLGFGGANLFKDFYIGPSFKLFDIVHVNTGINICEYDMLQKGFYEGEEFSNVASIAGGIPTVKQWKINFYLGIMFDFDLISSIPKKL